MAGIEVIAFVIILTLGIIGFVRGPSRELGVTMALVVLLAFLSQVDNLTPISEVPGKVNAVLMRLRLGSDDLARQRTTVWVIYSAVIIMTAFLAYHGQETLAFRFKGPPGLFGVIAGGGVGVLNGYLISGSIWYYLHQLSYPIQRYEWFRPEFTTSAQTMINYLPQNLASGLVMGALALGLLWWRIAK